ncbi:MAG: DNA polymerase III subunit gamma/tau [bacterium]|nr:DNA polymerase III subunit gamma/tau [bacterium]
MQVLYRKHRPRDFKEIVGQQHIVTALTNSLQSNRVAHAYLFSGPRGVGKTTVARILAKALNCLERGKPCNTCASCEKFNRGQAMNLVEIDAASNRGIDEIRDLRDSVKFVPAEGKYKVYVIDECHQLTKEAFNALLKTLEEPPAHAVFVLATTEIDKVLPTIISRTQRYDFRRPSVMQIVMRLEQVAKKENAILDKDAALLIALAAEGSLRDAESILGQIMAVEDKKITSGEVEAILGMPRREAAKKMFELVANRNTAGALGLIQELHESGYSLDYFSKLLLQFFRNAIFLKTDPSLKKFVEQDLLPDEIECISKNIVNLNPEYLSRAVSLISENMQSFRKSHLPQLPLEITVVELTTK